MTDSSVELTWDPVCIGDYRYDVEYAKLRGGTTAGQYHTTFSAYTNSVSICAALSSCEKVRHIVTKYLTDLDPAIL